MRNFINDLHKTIKKKQMNIIKQQKLRKHNLNFQILSRLKLAYYLV